MYLPISLFFFLSHLVTEQFSHISYIILANLCELVACHSSWSTDYYEKVSINLEESNDNLIYHSET